ncbi:MAG: c-type cytochrome [Planctomyces sp.]|nr:c-type cytochrome [Planctomyces sp.]
MIGPRRLTIVLGLAGILLAGTGKTWLQAADAPPASRPEWIWISDVSRESDGSQESAEVGPVRLTHEFTLEHSPAAAVLKVAADFCSVEIRINGDPVLAVAPFTQTVEQDVTTALTLGRNVVEAFATEIDGPSAIALSLSDTTTGRAWSVATGSNWQASSDSSKPTAVRTLGPVNAGLWGSGRRSIAIDAFDNYEQWRLATADNQVAESSFWLAPGFELTCIRTAAAEEGSWVSLTFDPQGRLIVAREDRGLLRMELNDDRTSVASVQTVEDTLLECRGLVFDGETLYANANNARGLYRLRDTTGDGRFDEATLLRELPGGVGHGRNDLAIGADGSLYSMHGDDVEIPTEGVMDQTSPSREPRRTGRSQEGWLMRRSADGQTTEVVAGGLRNPFGVAFAGDTEAFTYDADAEYDMGAPWYRPTRVVQLTRGADFGWRAVTGRWPPYFPDRPDHAPPTLDIGKGSPTAVMFGTDLEFPADYRHALYILDWAYGRVLAVHLAPRGSGCRAGAETFLKGRPLNVTDIAAGPDGSMYLTTGGRRTQSALYRVRWRGGPSPADDSAERASHEINCQNEARTARLVRQTLERLPAAPESVDAAWPHLDSPEPLLRHAARTAIERSPRAAWESRAFEESRPTALLEGLTALARLGDASLAPRIGARLLDLDFGTLTIDQKLMALNVWLLLQEAASADVLRLREPVIRQLQPELAAACAGGDWRSPFGGSVELRRQLARLLVSLEAPGIVPPVAAAFLRDARQEEQMYGLLILRNVPQSWSLDDRRLYLDVLNSSESFTGGEGMPRFLELLRKEFVASLTEAERESLFDWLEPPESADEALPPPRPVVRQWTLADLESLANDGTRAGDPRRGEKVFQQALCARCHKVGARGPSVGPDLTHVGSRFSRRDLLESIVEPSAVVAEIYRGVQVATTDGEVLSGRVLPGGDFRSEVLKIVSDPLRPSIVTEVHKRRIDEVRESPVSPMPTGLLDSFTEAEIADLLAYLTSGGVGSAR